MNYTKLLGLSLFLVTQQLVCQNAVDLRCEYLQDPIGVDAAQPRLSWRIQDHTTGALQTAYRILISTDEENKNIIWDSKKINSDQVLVKYQGPQLTPLTKYYWKVEVWDKNNKPSSSDLASFETGMQKVHNWKGEWISDGDEIESAAITTKNASYFRKEFMPLEKKIASARAYIAVGGLYELTINGQRIGNHKLDPAFTRYDRRNLYVTHDVTANIRQDKNAIGVLLGNGWYNHQSLAVWFFHNAPWRNRPTFCMDLYINYEDGTQQIISTNKDWKFSSSPIVFNSIYTGEHQDARLEKENWEMPQYNDAEWKNSVLRAAPSQKIVSQQLHPIRAIAKLDPVVINKIADTLYLVDFGKNIAGVTELSISGAPGTEFRLKHGEQLYENGCIDMSNLVAHYRPADDSDPFQTDIYTLKGEGIETFTPKFNYKGFQYVEVSSNTPFELKKEHIAAWEMHSDVPALGKIKTSNPLIDKIWQATNNSYLSNLFGYPTDCPQREKNGWTGDAHIAIETALYNFDGITIYEKWLADHQDEQQPNGTLPCIIPTSGWGYHWANGIDWTSTIAIIPWNIYLFYGDSSLLTQCYDNIKRYVDRISYLYPSGLTDWGLGDWIPVKTQSPVELSSSIYYYVDAWILSNAAKLLGNEMDYKKYSALSSKIKDAINAKYFHAEQAIYGKGSQTELSMPLYWGIVPQEYKQKVADNLAKRVNSDNTHLDVGLLGSKSILNALSDNGYADIAYALASNDSYPSWGWWIANGATTLFEDWDATSHSLSRNHIMFGEIGAWFYKALGGIKPDPTNPGFKNIQLKPLFIEKLEFANVSFNSPYGEIVSAWQRKGSRIIYHVTIPANTTASLQLPSGMKIKKIKTLSKGDYKINSQNGIYLLPSGDFECEIVEI